MKKFAILGLILGLVSACSVYFSLRPLDWDEREYLNRAMQSELTFQVPANESDAAWGRVRGFMDAHSSMPVSVSTDAVLQTDDPGDSRAFGYVARRASNESGSQFLVQCLPGKDPRKKECAVQNEHILAHYARTGEIVPRLIKM